MKHIAKKILAAISSAALLAGAVIAPSNGLTASAANSVTINGITYEYTQDYMGVAITKCTVPYNNTEVTIPNQIAGQDVIAVYDNAFTRSTAGYMTKLKMDSNSKIYKVGKNFCANCDDLAEITLSPRLQIVGDYSFYDLDGLNQLTFPNSVIVIGSYVCNWTYNMTKVVLGSNVQYIGAESFARMRDLTTFTSSSNSKLISVGENVLKNSKWANNRANNDGLYIGYNNRVLLRWQRRSTNPDVSLSNGVRVLADKAFSDPDWTHAYMVRNIYMPRVETFGSNVFDRVPQAIVHPSASLMYTTYGSNYDSYVRSVCAPASVQYMH